MICTRVNYLYSTQNCLYRRIIINHTLKTLKNMEQAKSFTREITVDITSDQIGRFIGPKGTSIKKFVIIKSVNSFTHGSAPDNLDDLPFPKVSLNKTKDGVMANISSHSEDLIDIVVENIGLHAASLRALGTNSPNKICRLVFKTNLDDHLIGKYIGKSGRHCKVLANLLQEDANDRNIDSVSSFRVNITKPEREPRKFFFIKNSSSSSNMVFIYVTAIYSGKPRPLFKAVQKRMINSVTSLISDDIANYKPEQPEQSDQPVLSAEYFLIHNTPESIVAELSTDSEAPLSPVYTPSSPTYTPSSPTIAGWESYDPSSEVSTW